MAAYLLIFITVVATAAGQIVLKYGQPSLYFPAAWSLKEVFAAVLRNALNPYFIAAFLCAAIGALSWSLAIQKNNLSFAYSFMSITYVLVFLASFFLFKEPAGWHQLIGSLLIVAGLVSITLK